MEEGYWVIRTYSSGAVGEKTKFWLPGPRPSRKAGRRERDQIRKQEQNESSCLKNLARVINANFGPGDLLLGLDYTDEGLRRIAARAGDMAGRSDREEPGDMEKYMRRAAEAELRNCLRRVKRAMEKEGAELQYVAVTSDMDGDTGEAVRLHYHLIVPREALEAFRAKWGLGGVHWSPLADQIDYTAVAEYLLRQVRRVPDAKKYMSSRNLLRPQPRDRIAVSGAEMRVPKGGRLLYRSAWRSERAAQYIRYMLPREKWKGVRAHGADEEKGAGAEHKPAGGGAAHPPGQGGGGG